MTSQTKGAPHQISNSIHRLLLESSMAGYWDWHIPSNEEYLSPRFKSMFGYEDHEDDLSLLLEQFDAHVSSKGEIPLAVTVRYRHKNGSVVHVKWNDH
jgi:two-component system, chemotaxis family, CheB/CheR fusion protein